MNKEDKNDAIELVKQLTPQIELRFVGQEEKRNLKKLFVSLGVVNTEQLTLKIFDKISENIDFSQLPTVIELEAIIYKVLSELKPVTLNYTPQLEATFQKFIRVFFKVLGSVVPLEAADVDTMNEKLTATLTSMAYNEGLDPDEVVNILKGFNLTAEKILVNNTPQNNMLQEFKELKFNILFETDKIRYLLDVGFNEVFAISDAIMKNSENVRIAGTLVRVCDIKDVKFFTITDPKALENEMYWSGTMNPDVRKAMDIGKWSVSKFSKFGKDVTTKFLTPVITPGVLVANSEIAEMSLSELLKSGEGSLIEFKSRLKGSKQDDSGKHIIKGIMQTIAAFLNSKGGYLLIGVNDDGTINGLEEDFKLITKENKEDGFKLEFDNLLSKLGNQVSTLITLDFVNYENKKIALVKVRKKFSKPIYLNNGEELYIRKNASNVKLNTQASFDYVNEHWQKN
ncbi:MAG: ATP-binding protein [Bacteroidia bacterium]|nr:ATP-binding protein [Bacteroidia bacterium]